MDVVFHPVDRQLAGGAQIKQLHWRNGMPSATDGQQNDTIAVLVGEGSDDS